MLHVFLNMHIRSEYHWTPFSGCIHIQFEFVRCFGSLCYSTDIWLWIIVSSRFQPHNTIVTLVSSTLWGNQLNQSLAGWPTFWKSILRVARGNAFVYFMRRPIRWPPYYPTYDDEALLRWIRMSWSSFITLPEAAYSELRASIMISPLWWANGIEPP